NSKVARHGPDAADFHHVCVGVVAFEPSIGSLRTREVFVARSVRDGEAIIHLPLIASVETVALHSRRVRRNGLVEPSELIRQAEEERAPCIEAVSGWSPRQLRRAAA